MKYPYTGPINNEKNVSVTRKKVSKLFNQKIVLGDSGKATLRKGNQNGSIHEIFDVSDDNVYVSGRELILELKKPLPYDTEIFLVMDDGFVKSAISGEKYCKLNSKSEKTYKFTTESSIGKPLDGGIIVSKFGGRYLIVSPKETELTLSLYSKKDAINYAEKITGTSGWSIPSSSLLMNEEFINIDLWLNDNYDGNLFWSSDEYEDKAYIVNLKKGQHYRTLINKNSIHKIRTFKFKSI